MDNATLHSQSPKFWAKVEPFVALNACWVWTGKTKRGYGEWWASCDGKRLYSSAHRAAYRLLVGPIPDGMQLDHLCRNRSCVNPDHLEPVTPGENVRRGRSGDHLKRKIVAGVPKCKNGHEVTGENARPRRAGTYMACLECERDGTQRFRDRHEIVVAVRPKRITP